ncbi:hypothetical protein M407DRAFT_120186 [Tulasnella calospora MUT 4182]|uniref:Uncharacterized protein n=1 Tax=Tulasnella calospora MUT 4182 TaxID=1051891 RepID=A0A0C3Q1M7_9AGAM|nr:hypothetical protein M407DRAFT_120186 [Tulasnella calospora MUT 4182]
MKWTRRDLFLHVGGFSRMSHVHKAIQNGPNTSHCPTRRIHFLRPPCKHFDDLANSVNSSTLGTKCQKKKRGC